VLGRPAHQHVAFLGAPGVTYEELPPPPTLAPWLAVEGAVIGAVSFAPWLHD